LSVAGLSEFDYKQDQRSALHLAAQKGFEEIVRLLLASGAEVMALQMRAGRFVYA
jgi:ankyrin repeat protein